jgi:DNA polymerase-3 subunit delta
MQNLFLFTGPETFLIHEQINAWKKAFIEKHGGDMNLITINGADTEVGDIISQLETAPFLGDKRLIFIEGLPEAPKTRNADKVTKKDEARDEQLKKLAEYLPKIPESSVVIFVQSNPDKRKSLYKKIVQASEVKEFSQLTGGALNSWVQNQVKVRGGNIDPSTAEYLISLTGPDLWRLNQEIQKICSFTGVEPINRSIIDKLVIPTIEANVFHLTDALGAKDHYKAIQNLHRSIQAGENLRQTFYMIVRQFRLFLQIGGYLSNYPSTNPASVASSLKIHPFVARNTMGQLKRFSIEEIKAAYEKLLKIDVALKTSGIRITVDDQDELAMAIERFIVGFCR